MNELYYYVSVNNPYKIESTEYIEDLVTSLFNGDTDFISESQRKELKLPSSYFKDLRKSISRYDESVPLYDIKYGHVFLIHSIYIYPRIYRNDFRFVSQNFYDELVKIKEPSDIEKENIRVLSYYDLKVLNKTYMKLFYQSFVLNHYITDCRRPSFASGMEHISPYYSIKELYFMAYDWGLIEKRVWSVDDISKYCKQISKFDILAEILLEHQMYIYDSRAVGLVKHYSLYGSYYMNMYLRKNRCCLQERESYEDTIRNLDLENQIVLMIKLIKNAPVFTEEHTVYRFIQKDDYLSHLEIGDIYRDSSFMSTTRNPFYYNENNPFGYILIKIKLPKNIKGIALCIESYSNFPVEQEIILPPTSRYELNKVSDSEDIIKLYGAMDLVIKKKYEFTWVGNDYTDKENTNISIDMPDAYIPEIKNVELKEIMDSDNINYLSIPERLGFFKENYCNINNQFISTIGGNRYVFNFESYNSSSVYKQFFYYEVCDGIMVTTSNPKFGNINVIMELGPEIHVNYYFRYSVTDSSFLVDLSRPEWIEWLSLFAYIIGSRTVIIHSNYILQYDKSASIEKIRNQTRYAFSQNVYLYMKYKKRMFEFLEITPNFDYPQLDYLFAYPVQDAIKITDKNELYYVAHISKTTNMGEFYLYIVENRPDLLGVLEEKMDSIYESGKNPFNSISYSLDAWLYLYNRDIIKQIPNDKEFIVKKGAFKKLITSGNIQKFENRLKLR